MSPTSPPRCLQTRASGNDYFVLGLMKKLTLYATGREPDVADLAEIRALMKAHAARGYPMRDLLKGLLRSRVFLGP